jgi:hypothetical protein
MAYDVYHAFHGLHMDLIIFTHAACLRLEQSYQNWQMEKGKQYRL